MTTHIDFAEELDAIAVLIVELPGVSRTNPHAFAEAKSELAARLRNRAVELRAGLAAARRSVVGAIAPGTRVIGARRVPVEVRRARAR